MAGGGPVCPGGALLGGHRAAPGALPPGTAAAPAVPVPVPVPPGGAALSPGPGAALGPSPPAGTRLCRGGAVPGGGAGARPPPRPAPPPPPRGAPAEARLGAGAPGDAAPQLSGARRRVRGAGRTMVQRFSLRRQLSKVGAGGAAFVRPSRGHKAAQPAARPGDGDGDRNRDRGSDTDTAAIGRRGSGEAAASAPG